MCVYRSVRRQEQPVREAGLRIRGRVTRKRDASLRWADSRMERRPTNVDGLRDANSAESRDYKEASHTHIPLCLAFLQFR